jgi:hypothetical protein
MALRANYHGPGLARGLPVGPGAKCPAGPGAWSLKLRVRVGLRAPAVQA